MMAIFTLSEPVALLWPADKDLSAADLEDETADLGDERTGDLGAPAFPRSSLSNLTLRVDLSRGEEGTLDIATPLADFLTPTSGAAEEASPWTSPLDDDDWMAGSWGPLPERGGAPMLE